MIELMDIVTNKTCFDREISAQQLESDSHIRNLEDLQRLLHDVEAQRDAAQQKVQQMEKDLQRRGRDVEVSCVILACWKVGFIVSGV